MMDHPNKKDHNLSKISSSYSNCAHGSKHLMKQKNIISVCSEIASSSDKYDYSKLYMNENSNVSTETDIKGDKITKCDIVKQFDELISELSKSEEQEEKTSYSYDLCDIVQENMKNNMKNFSENIPFSKNYTNNSLCEVKPFQNVINPMELNGISPALKDHSKFDCSSMSAKKQIENSVLGTEGKISWIDSNLWSFENKKQVQKPASQVNKTTDVLTDCFKGTHFNITQPVASNSRLTDTSNPSAFYTMKASMKKDVKHSGYTAVMKNDYRRYPHSEATYKGMNVCKSDFRVKMGNTVSLLHSPRTSRSPVSKYMLPNNCFVVKLFVETRDLHLGPFPFEIYPKMSLRLLKLKVEQEHGIISSSQKWILGKCFAADNEKSLVDYNVMPGSSIILYVDNNQRISYDASKNEFIGVKNTTKNNKMIIENTAEDDKELNTVSESLHSKPEQIEVSELLRNNSFDSIPTDACSKTNDDCNVKSQNNLNTSLHKEQYINSASSGEICENIKSPIIKKKGLKKSTELKKKTKAVVPVLADISRSNLDENSFFDKPQSTNINNHIFLKENKSTPGNLLDSVETGAVYESNSNQFQEALVEDLITFQTNNSSNLKEHNQPSPFAETATISLNSSLRSSTQDIMLPETSKSFPLSDILKDNLSGSSRSNISPIDSNKNFCESKNRNDDKDYEDSSFYVAETNVNGRDEFLVEEPENLILSDVNISTEKEIIKTMHHVAVEGKFSFNDYSKKKEKNVKDISDSKKEVNNVLSTENPENSNMSRLEEGEKVEISLNKIGSLESSILKPKRSVSSLIRKLSLTCKVKSLDDSSSSHNISSDKFCDDRTDEKTSNQTTLILDQSQYNDVHIEISPQNPDLLSTKDETTVQCENVIPLEEDHTVHNPESIKNFELLLEIENMDIVENPTNFTCPVCFDEFESGQGVILHDCLHVFCRICLASAINYADGALVMCPYRDDFYSCQSHLQQREIKALVSEDAYEKYLQRSIITAEGSEERSFHCKTLDCPGWCIYDNAINVFHCPVCFHYNCLNCQAIHEGLNCRQYQNKLKLQQKIDQDAQKTLELLNKMIDGGKAIRCPKCDLILMKKWGCDWLKCSICQTEICWITKGPRWGPGGQGDTSGGCRCGVNGVKCHPSCTYCH